MKVWDEIKGWGEVIMVEGTKVLVRWDADPWFPTWEDGEVED